MRYATRGDQTLRATARNFAYYLLRDLQDPVRKFLDFDSGSIPADQSYLSGRAAGSKIACVGSIPCGRDSANLTFAAVCDCYVPVGHILPARGSRFTWGGEAGHNPTLAYYP